MENLRTCFLKKSQGRIKLEAVPLPLVFQSYASMYTIRWFKIEREFMCFLKKHQGKDSDTTNFKLH